MRSNSFLLAWMPLVAFPAQSLLRVDAPSTFSNRQIFAPPSNYTNPRVLYPRTVELADGTLLATWENYSPEPPTVYFPIYESQDSGASWKLISRVEDQVNGLGLRYQPFLYELPEDVGVFKAGTILCAGNSIPTNLGRTQIDVYASEDKGRTWTFVSHVAAGGKAKPNNGETPVWEPFLLLYQSELILYYSDQRDPKHGQKLSHQTTRDLKTWSAPIDDAAYADFAARPGMSTVAALPNGKYLMTYEYGGAPGFRSYSFPVYYRVADDPRAFATAREYPLVAAGGVTPTSSPYVTWTPAGGKDGTVVVSGYSHGQIFTNRALGAEKSWEVYVVDQPPAYTRHLRVLRGDSNRLLIIGAGKLPPSNGNTVTVSLVDLRKTMKLA